MAHVSPEVTRFREMVVHALSAACALAVSLAFPLAALAVGPDAQPIEKVYKDVREAERYQLKIADQYYRDQNYEVAASEYEKFLSLYESSVGAPYVQLRWSHCQVELRKLNTAIRDGYQSLVDYWPESPEAVVAQLSIGRAYRDSGETKKAKKAYNDLIQKHPDHLMSVYAKLDLVEMAQASKDDAGLALALKDLVYQTKNEEPRAVELRRKGAQDLATFSFSQGKFAEGSQAIETAFDPTQRAQQVNYYVRGPVQALTGVEATKAQGERVAEEAGKYIRGLLPQDLKDPAQRAIAYQYYDWIAEIEHYARRYDKQLAVYQEMLKLFGEDSSGFERLATWYKAQQKFDDELGVYNQMLAKLGPNDRTFGFIAQWHTARKQFPEAQSFYGRFQDQLEGQRQLAHMARHYWPNYDLAIQTYQNLTQIDATRAADYQWEIGECLRHQGKYKEAIRVFALCDSKAPSHIDRIAQCHRDLKEWDEAVLMYKQEGTYKGYESHAMYSVAQTYEMAGRKEAAIKSFQEVCRRYPKTEHASNAHAHLQNEYKISATLGGATEEK